jgi:hypothetical protein
LHFQKSKIPKRIKKNFGKKEKGKLLFTFLLSAGGISLPFGSPIKRSAGGSSSSHPFSS